MRGRRSEETASTAPSCTTATNARRKATATNGRREPAKKTPRMEMYDHFYTNFERPPFAAIYTPTEEEFSDPIKYVEKIRPEAEKYGVVKIVPPKNFKPPFAINKETFCFKPRTQKLNEVEAIVKEKHTFVERLLNFNMMSGLPYVLPVDNNGIPIDLHRLHRIVQNFGGFTAVDESDLWKDVAREMIPPEKLSRGVPNVYVNVLKKQYTEHVEPFIRNLNERAKQEDESDDELEELKHKYQHHHGTMRTENVGSSADLLSEPDDEEEDEDYMDEEEEEEADVVEVPVSMQRGRQRPKRVRQSRMMAAKRTQGTPKKRRTKKKEIELTVICIECHKGDDEENLLLCDNESDGKCLNGRHTYCCDPKLDEVPKGDWRCPSCIVKEDAKIGLDWGFCDGEVEYNLNTFSDFANKFKTDYFGIKKPTDVPSETVEKEFWTNLISPGDPVCVKYGADLISNRVGSGFPRKDDKFTGHDAKNKQHYANHAWNLNNLPVLKESVLSHFQCDISGMMVPWVYVGMCFSTFCWHTEDHWTYSVNYNHWGERKIWYGVGGGDAVVFEDALRKLAPGLTGRQRDIFHHMTTAANPSLLRSMGVPITTVHQNAGEFVITFPRAYHSGFNEGLNFAEAVNFAPIDWLSRGRGCMDDYALSRRYCVFSHEELVFKMIDARDKLGVPMSLATLDELLDISKREKSMRGKVTKSGIKKVQRVLFEDVPDDQRACRFCRTTVFLSAVSCKHDTISCLAHFDHCCKQCTPASHVLKYRYDLDELSDLVVELEKRTKGYSQWKTSADMILQKEEKPDIGAVDSIIDSAKQKHFPTNGYYQKIVSLKQNTQKAIERVNTLLNGKVRTRTKTRIQRADTRMDIDGVRSFIDEMATMEVDMKPSIVKLQNLVMRIEEWQKLAQKMIENSDEYSKNDIEVFMEEGDSFDIKLEEMDALRKLLEIKDWIVQVRELTEWKSHFGMEFDDNFEVKQRWSSADIMKITREGSRVLTETTKEELRKLQMMLRAATTSEEEAKKFLDNPSLDAFQTCWKTLREFDWLSDKYMNEIRSEVCVVYNIVSMLGRLFSETVTLTEISDRLKYVINSEIKFSSLIELIDLCESSRCLEKSQELKVLIDVKKNMDVFSGKITKLFKPNHCYYNIVQILCEREDIQMLINGQQVKLYLQQDDVSPVDDWDELNGFDSLEHMLEHQNTLKGSHKESMQILHEANISRGIETCSCGGTIDSDPKYPSVLSCLLCNGMYHVKCSEWNPLFDKLPEGCFLCIRCLRGRRPNLEDVQAACIGIPNASLEHKAIQLLIQKSNELTEQLLESAKKLNSGNPEDVDNCKSSVLEWLSCEVLNTKGLPKAIEIINLMFTDILNEQISSFSALRSRPRFYRARHILFDKKLANKRGKRGSNLHHKESAKKSKKDDDSDSDDMAIDTKQCATVDCKSTEHDKSVICESGCGRWSHSKCTGLTEEQILLSGYTCDLCQARISPSSESSFA